MAEDQFGIDPQFLIDTTREFIETPSPVGYYPETGALLEKKAAEYGYQVEWDRKRTPYIKIEGEDTSKTVMLGAHLDTIGLVVRGFNDDGTLRVRRLGGVSYPSLEGVSVNVICRDGKKVPGWMVAEKHSVHVFEGSRDMPRDEDHEFVKLMADVKNPADARALGICEGCVIDPDPHFQSFENGYMLSRYIDDKACVACAFGVLEYLKATGKKPKYNTWLSFPIYEEIGHGGAYVPEEVSEFVALDITLIGPDYDSDEHQVGVVASDAHGPYDWELTNKLAACAKAAGCNWNQQVCFHFSTDAMAAYVNGMNLAAGACGPACYSTHGRERTHVDSLVETTKLAIAYVMGMGE